ncbi:MAG: hypothetical protein KDC05_02015 [Bacteroidales bacterium]|nr:hypothetical protein [Bacteroidales bacterium]
MEKVLVARAAGVIDFYLIQNIDHKYVLKTGADQVNKHFILQQKYTCLSSTAVYFSKIEELRGRKKLPTKGIDRLKPN